MQDSQKTIDKSDTPPQTPTTTQQQQALTLNRAQSEPGEEFDEDVEEETPMVPDNQTLLRMLEENEKVTNNIIFSYFIFFIASIICFRFHTCFDVQEFKAWIHQKA